MLYSKTYMMFDSHMIYYAQDMMCSLHYDIVHDSHMNDLLQSLTLYSISYSFFTLPYIDNDVWIVEVT